MDTVNLPALIMLVSVSLVASSIILVGLLKRSDTPTEDSGQQSTSDSEEKDTIEYTVFPWFDKSRELTPTDLEYLSGLRTSMEHWRKEVETGKLSSQIPSPIVLASITRGNFLATLTCDSGYFIIALRDAVSGTVALIDLISASTGESNG